MQPQTSSTYFSNINKPIFPVSQYKPEEKITLWDIEQLKCKINFIESMLGDFYGTDIKLKILTKKVQRLEASITTLTEKIEQLSKALEYKHPSHPELYL